MAIRPFLAMTAAEIRNTAILPSRTAWMACHFSPYGRGLSNIPSVLEEGSLLILDDITPIRGHDPEVITQQLMQAMEHLRVSGILPRSCLPMLRGECGLPGVSLAGSTFRAA